MYAHGDLITYKLGKRTYQGTVLGRRPAGSVNIKVRNKELRIDETIPVDAILWHQPTLFR